MTMEQQKYYVDQLRKQLETEEQKLKEMEELKGWPQNGDDVFVITSTGRICPFEWRGHHTDLNSKAIGNIYRIKEEAENHVEHLKARKELIDCIARHNDGWVPEWRKSHQLKGFFAFEHENIGVGYRSTGCVQALPNELYFNPKHYESILKELGKDKIRKAMQWD
jgi:hypothetical protein